MKLLAVVLAIAVFAASLPALSQPLPTARPESVGFSSDRLAILGEAIEREIAGGRMPGAVVAISRRGKLAYYESFGYLDSDARILMSEDAIFSIASMTKPIFAVAAMILFERGELLLNEPVASYLPELGELRVAVGGDPAKTVPAQTQPTIRDLMRHTSGHPGRGVSDSPVRDRYEGLYPNGLLQPTTTNTEYLAALADLPLAYEPGTTWDYALGFDLLGIVIERVTGQSAIEFLGENLFEPLGMHNTQFRIPVDRSDRQAKPLPTDPISGAAQTVRDQSIAREIDCGSGCLSSTVDDYLKFAQMLLNGGQLNGVRILGPKTVEYMTSDHSASGVDLTNLHNFEVTHTDGFGFGMGVAVRRSAGGGGTVGSPGAYEWSGSQGTAFWIDPEEELVIVYMAQTPGALRRYYRQLIPALVYQALTD